MVSCSETSSGNEHTKFSMQVCDMAAYLCKLTMFESEFLQYKSSQIAAAVILFALNAQTENLNYSLESYEKVP